MRRAPAVVAVAVLVLAAPALAEDRPAIFPTRDVDVTYGVPQPGAPAGTPRLEQRMRYSAATSRQRVDPPTSGLYMVMDFSAHTISTVRPDARMILDMPTAAAQVPATAQQNFVRLGQDTVAGLACTEWSTTDAAGEAARVCITGDGVLLRARAADRLLLQAVRVRYDPQPPEVFAMPGGYKHLPAPPLPAR